MALERRRKGRQLPTTEMFGEYTADRRDEWRELVKRCLYPLLYAIPAHLLAPNLYNCLCGSIKLAL